MDPYWNYLAPHAQYAPTSCEVIGYFTIRIIGQKDIDLLIANPSFTTECLVPIQNPKKGFAHSVPILAWSA